MPLTPCITNSAPGVSLYAPAGSGGGGSVVSPDLTVSTLTVADGSTGNNGIVFDAGSASTFVVQSDDGTDFPAFGKVLEFLEGDGTPTVVGLGANLIVGNIGLVGRGGGFSSQTPGIIAGLGNGGVSISSLTCSSINGVNLVGSLNMASESANLNLSLPKDDVVLFNYTSSATTFAQIEMVKNVNNTGLGGVKLNGGQDPATLYVGGNKIDLDAVYVGVSSLTVSSINGAAPALTNPSTFVSSIGLTTIAATTSSILTEMPVGLCAYSFLGDNTTSDATVSGMMNVVVDNNGNKIPSFTNFNGGLNGPNVFPYIDDSIPSQPKFGIANNSINILDFTGTLSRLI